MRVSKMKTHDLLPAGTALVVVLALGFSTGCKEAVMTDETRTEQASGAVGGGETAVAPGKAAIVISGGRVVFERCEGVTDLRTRRPITPRTNFRLASVSKQFTAAAVMLLVRDGKLRYEDSLTSVFPDFPAYGRAITVRMLLQHTSGLADYEDLMAPVDPALPVEKVQIHDAGVLDLLKAQTTARFTPGTRWAYSNSGYVLLGVIVERVSGMPFSRFLGERIFAPLGMGRAVAFELGKNEVDERAYGHTPENGTFRETDQSPTSATLGDGGVYSSLEDLAKWDAALRGHTLLSEKDFEPALVPVVVPEAPPVGPDGSPAAYGFGWFLDPWKGRARMWHYGETIGFRTAIQRFPEEGLTVIVLANRADADAIGESLRLAEEYLGKLDGGKRER